MDWLLVFATIGVLTCLAGVSAIIAELLNAHMRRKEADNAKNPSPETMA